MFGNAREIYKQEISLTPATIAQDAIFIIYKHLLKQIQINYNGTKLLIQPEFLHDFRVAIRRTRTVLSQFKIIFPESDIKYFKTDFFWLTRFTSPLRDLDVFFEQLTGINNCLQIFDPYIGHLILSSIGQKKKDEQKLFLLNLDSERYKDLIQRWRAFLDRGPSSQSISSLSLEPISHFASKWIIDSQRRFINRGNLVSIRSSDERFHKLRIAGKKYRYMLEFFRSLYSPDQIDAHIRELKQLQDILGNYNDLTVQKKIIQNLQATDIVKENVPEFEVSLVQLINELDLKHQAIRESFKEYWLKTFNSDNIRNLEKKLVDFHVKVDRALGRNKDPILN